MMFYRIRRWSNIKSKLVQRLVFAGIGCLSGPDVVIRRAVQVVFENNAGNIQKIMFTLDPLTDFDTCPRSNHG